MKQTTLIAVLCAFLATSVTIAESATSSRPIGSSAATGSTDSSRPSGSSRLPAKTSGAPMMIKPHKIDALNNVVSMESEGSRTALCLCGKTLPVMADTPSVTQDGTTFYLCSADCVKMASKALEKDWKSATENWRARFATIKFLSNARMKEGREMATCLCGRVFEVNSRTLAVAENGLVVHCCSAACDKQFRAAPSEGRMQAELALLPAAKSEPHPSVEVIYRGPGESWTAEAASPGSVSN